jgi:hypothetical protein
MFAWFCLMICFLPALDHLTAFSCVHALIVHDAFVVKVREADDLKIAQPFNRWAIFDRPLRGLYLALLLACHGHE